jgi:uronate dehydrogenase
MNGHLGSAGGLIDPSMPVAPCCPYGASKAFAEAIGYVIATTSDTTVVCLRLGATAPAPPTRSELGGWLGPADLRQLVHAATAAEVRFGTYFGVSANTPPVFALDNAREELGYEPMQDSADYGDSVPEGDGSFGHGPRR